MCHRPKCARKGVWSGLRCLSASVIRDLCTQYVRPVLSFWQGKVLLSLIDRTQCRRLQAAAEFNDKPKADIFLKLLTLASELA